MSTKGGPMIITDGLVLALDAADINSYPGTGTIWKDLSGNGNDFTFINTPIYNSTYFTLNGADNGFEILNFPQVFSGSVTFEGWFYFNNDGRDVLFGNYNGSPIMNFERYTNNQLRLYWNNGPDGRSSINILEENKWQHIVMVRNKENLTFDYYVNSMLKDSVSVTTAPDYTTVASHFRLGKDYRVDSTSLNGNIASVKFYNKALTSEEVSQNYNAQKSRFNL